MFDRIALVWRWVVAARDNDAGIRLGEASEASPAEADLEAAADVAAHFSRGRGNARVPVVMVPTDDLQRIAGAALQQYGNPYFPFDSPHFGRRCQT